MTQLESIDVARERVRRCLVEAGASPESTLSESLLIRDGHYCGRRFELDGLSAMWFAEEHEIKLYGRDGHFRQVVRTELPQRNVA